MKKIMTICTIATMILTVSGLTQAALLHHESFESGLGDWTNYLSEVSVVGSGTGGISATDGSYYAVILDPDPLPSEYYSGAYSRLGGYSSTFGGGWGSSIDIYIDLTDSRIADGTYLFLLSQAINDNSGNHTQDNIFQVGALDTDTDGSYEVYVNASHTTDVWLTRNTTPYGGHAITPGQFTESGWYTFMYEFAPSQERAGFVEVSFDVLATDDSSVFSTSWTTEDYTLSEAGGNRYLWFTQADTDGLAIDNVSVVPEPATLSLLGLGGMLFRRRK